MTDQHPAARAIARLICAGDVHGADTAALTDAKAAGYSATDLLMIVTDALASILDDQGLKLADLPSLTQAVTRSAEAFDE